MSYSTELSACLSFVEEVLDEGLPSVILGDMNFPCDISNEGYKQCDNNVLARYNVINCDEFMNNGNCFTYQNYSLGHFSFVDHVFVSNSIRQDIVSAECTTLV